MARRTQAYQDGEFIYRELDPANGAYEVLSGSVELFREDTTSTKLGTFTPGQMFGEMGLVGGGVREASARAIGPVKVRLISREVSDAQRHRTESGKGILGRFMEQMMAPADPEKSSAFVSPSIEGLGFIQRVTDFIHPAAGRIEVRVAQFSGDHNGVVTKQVIASLEKFRDIHVRPIGRPLEINISKDLAAEFGRAAKLARRWLIERQADILIWGHLPSPGNIVHIHFIPLAPWDERIPGGFDLTTDLPLPFGLEGKFADFLHAAILSATVPINSAKAHMRRSALAAGSAVLEASMENFSSDMAQSDLASLHLCYGNILTALWSSMRVPEHLVKAINAYREATANTKTDEPSIDWAMAHKHLSSLFYLRAEMEKDMAGYEESAASALSALELFTKEEMPYEWAALQHRLGLIHYRLGYEEGHTGTLRQALRCHQNALKIYSKRLTPIRWAEVMSGFARTAQVFGEHVKSLEAMATAANAYHAVLEIRDPKNNPLAWAATQNNLGSALFLLGRKANSPDRIKSAIVAFEAALEAYKLKNKQREAVIIGKNLDRAHQLLKDISPNGSYAAIALQQQASSIEDLDPALSNNLGSNVLDNTEIDIDLSDTSTIH